MVFSPANLGTGAAIAAPSSTAAPIGLFRSIFKIIVVSLVPQFHSPALQTALSCYQLGNELAAKGQYELATRKFHEGIHVGRPVVRELTENIDFIHMADDDPTSALELLTQSYVASSDAHIQLGDLDSARRDAWAACLVTNNQNKAGLECMLHVCNVAGDRIGELSTLKLLLEYTKSEQRRQQERIRQDQDGLGLVSSSSSSLSSWSSSSFLDGDDMELIQLSRRIAEVQRYLDNELAERMKMKKKSKNGEAAGMTDEMFEEEEDDDDTENKQNK